MGLNASYLDAQYSVIGCVLIEPSLIPRMVADLREEDFSGACQEVYRIIRDAFMEDGEALDVVSIADRTDSDAMRKLLIQCMEITPTASSYGMYAQICKKRSKLYRLHDLGRELNEAADLTAAEEIADGIGKELMVRTGNRFYGPEELIASFEERHREKMDRLPWPIKAMTDMIPTRPGNMIAVCAEPSGGKTAWGLQMMWDIAKKYRTVFISLETDKDTLFDTWNAFISGIGMESLMDGPLNGEEWKRFRAATPEIRKRKFEILPASYMTVAGIKAAAISHQAEVVIVDYLQIVTAPGMGSRYEVVTEISQGLHSMAQETGITVIALCQVTRKDQASQNAPLNLFSVRESSQISQDMDVMVMLDTFIEKDIREAGVKANRMIRVVKNKRGRKFVTPAMFDGRFQKFDAVAMPNAELEKLKAAGRKGRNNSTPVLNQPAEEEMEQLPIDTEVPF